MLHPLGQDLSLLKDAELEEKVSDLTRKYFITHNPMLREQIASMLDAYRLELQDRRSRVLTQEYQNREKGLDNLINVN